MCWDPHWPRALPDAHSSLIVPLKEKIIIHTLSHYWLVLLQYTHHEREDVMMHLLQIYRGTTPAISSPWRMGTIPCHSPVSPPREALPVLGQGPPVRSQNEAMDSLGSTCPFSGWKFSVPETCRVSPYKQELCLQHLTAKGPEANAKNQIIPS